MHRTNTSNKEERETRRYMMEVSVVFTCFSRYHRLVHSITFFELAPSNISYIHSDSSSKISVFLIGIKIMKVDFRFREGNSHLVWDTLMPYKNRPNWGRVNHRPSTLLQLSTNLLDTMSATSPVRGNTTGSSGPSKLHPRTGRVCVINVLSIPPTLS